MDLSDRLIVGKVDGDIRLSQPLRTILCRFDSGKLIKECLSIHDVKYITISHVWGNARWQEVLGEEILVSDEKAAFIRERLISIVGNELFWMDILCINQRDKDARVAVTQHIPAIFRCAQKTIVVKNSGGIRDCCLQAIGSVDTKNDIERAVRAATDHILSHETDNGGRIKEGVFERLWVLQEVILSRCLQFVRCDSVGIDYEPKESFRLPQPSTYDFLAFIIGSTSVWGWNEQDNDDENNSKARFNFLQAFIYNGIVCRNQPIQLQPFPSRTDLLPYRHSTRLTSHPRDFILAIMPQYDFYTVPKNARQMSFGELFADCCQQGLKAGWDLAPLLTSESGEGTRMFSITNNIPHPVCLGDMVKLFLGPKPVTYGTGWRTEAVHVDRFIYTGNASETIQLIYDCLNISQSAQLYLGDLWLATERNQHLLWTNQENRTSEENRRLAFGLAALILQTIEGNLDSPSLRSRMENEILSWPEVVPALVQLAALIGCGLGSSAFFWSWNKQTPVVVRFRNRNILALVSNSVLAEDDCKFYLIEAERIFSGESWILLAMKGDFQKPSFYCIGLFPQSLKPD